MKKTLYSLRLRSRLLLLCLLLTLVCQARELRDTSDITLHVVNQPIESIFKLIEKQTGLAFFYGNSIINSRIRVSISVDRASLSEVMTILMKGHNISWIIKNGGILLSRIIPTPDKVAPNDTVPLIDIDGKVLDKAGNPIPGATVTLKGNARGQGTDSQGRFRFAKVAPNGILSVSSVGFDSKLIGINNRSEITIVLDSAIREIEAVEVISTGYQNVPKERATGSFVQISNKVYNEQVGTNILDRLPAITSGMGYIPKRSGTNALDITIRGINTFTGPKQPLIVVDNFPFEGDINSINPNDVDNITILRDAAAASIWGARAGNGVIVINTKKGKYNSKLQVDFSSTLTTSLKPDLGYLKPINASDFIDVEQFLFNNGHYDGDLDFNPIGFKTPVVDILEKIRKGEIGESEGKAAIDKFRNNDILNEYKKYIYTNSFNQQYSINISGGSQSNAWQASASYDKNRDDLRSKFQRYSVRLENTFKPIESLQLLTSLTYSQVNSKSGASSYGTLPDGINVPYQLFKDEGGVPIGAGLYRQAFLDTIGQGRLLDWNLYPSEDYKSNFNTAATSNLLARFGLKYSVVKGVSLEINYQQQTQNTTDRTNYGIDSYFTRDMINKFSQINYDNMTVAYNVPIGGILDVSEVKLKAQNVRAQVNVDKRIGAGFLNALVGGEVRDISMDRSSSRSYGYNEELKTNVLIDPITQFPQVVDLWGTSRIPTNNLMSETVTKYLSVFSNVAYSFNDKYIVSGSFRRDASNLFGVRSNDKWSPLWSVGGSWNIGNENFFRVNAIPILRLRGSYGSAGNVIPSASAVTTIRYMSSSIYTGSTRAEVNNYRNDDLKWEKVKTLNVGVDFGLKDKRLTGSVEYYHKWAVDLYAGSPYDRTLGLGISLLVKNNGEMKGDGLDLMLNSLNVAGEDFKWSTNLNLSYYKDRVTKTYFPYVAAGSFVGGEAVTQGYDRYPIFSLKFAGLDSQTGDPLGILNGKPNKNYNALYLDSATINDLNYHGSATPRVFGNIGNTFNWRDFALSIRMSYQFGHYFRRNSIDYSQLFEQGLGHQDFQQRWKVPGDETKTFVPSMVYPNDYMRDVFYTYSEPLISKADNIRLEYISLSYHLARNRITKLPFKNVRFALIINNLGLIWAANDYGIDPLYLDNSFPVPMNFNFNISTNF